MSLRARIAVAIVGLAVGVVVVLALATQARVIRPLAQEARGAFAGQAVYLAQHLQRGGDEQDLEETFDVQIEQVDGPPAGARALVTRRTRGGRERPRVMVPRRGPELYVRNRTGWLMVRPELDLERPSRALMRVSAVSAALLIFIALVIAAASVRPLDRARRAMERVAAGDLDHRLDESGPAEIAGLARSFNGMTSRVQGLLRSERDLLAGVSHELRTPISRLRLAVELLRDHPVPERHLRGMEGDLLELEALIRELLEVSRLQMGESVLNLSEVDLLEVAEAVGEGNERVVVRGIAHRLTGDERLVHRAVDNLVRNALKYAPDGFIEVVVSAGEVAVHDRGPGVPEASLSRIFEPFYRVDQSRSRATGGTGIGLRIVQHVAELHGGQATAELRDGGGLSVRLTLNSVPAGAPQ